MKKSGKDVSKVKVRTRVATLICKLCGDTIFSRARHDFRACSCGAVSIDGGFDYTSINAYPDSMILKFRYIPATRNDLYRDWCLGINEYGLITAPKQQKRGKCNVKTKT